MSFPTIALAFERLSAEEGRARARAFLASIRRRRTVRDFAPEPVPADINDSAIEAAATAPSSANRQPWRFVVVSDPAIKKKIREAAEAEEREFYERRAPPEWLSDLAPLGTDWHKPFLETAPLRAGQVVEDCPGRRFDLDVLDVECLHEVTSCPFGLPGRRTCDRHAADSTSIFFSSIAPRCHQQLP
jgi:hypothetical protein